MCLHHLSLSKQLTNSGDKFNFDYSPRFWIGSVTMIRLPHEG